MKRRGKLSETTRLVRNSFFSQDSRLNVLLQMRVSKEEMENREKSKITIVKDQ